MAHTHIHTQNVSAGGGVIGGGATVTVTGSGRASISESVPTATTNQQLVIAFPITDLKSLVIYSDYAVTLKINSSGTPDQTISVLAGKALTWYTGGYYANPIDQAVTAMYVSNSSGSTAALEIEALYDGTPS